jgi:hypothetical protein
MATQHLNPELPSITPLQRLAGWHLELCVEVTSDADARIYVRAVEKGSFKAAELKRGILFQRLDTRFDDVAGWYEASRADLERLVGTARRIRPSKENLFTTLEYDRMAWDQVQAGIDRWARRHVAPPGGATLRRAAPGGTQQTASRS